MGEDGEGLGFTVFLLESFFELQPLGVSPEKEDGSFGEGPLEVGVADLLPGSAVAFAGGFLGALDEASVGDEVLDAWEAADVVDFVKDDQGEDGTDAVDGFQEMEGVGIVFSGVTKDVAFEIPLQSVEVIDKIEIGLDAPSNDGIVELFCDSLAVDLVSGNRTVIADQNVGFGPMLSNPSAIALDSDNNRALVADGIVPATLYWVDLASGNRTALTDTTNLGPVLLNVPSLIYDAPNDRAFAIDSDIEGVAVIEAASGQRAIVSR